MSETEIQQLFNDYSHIIWPLIAAFAGWIVLMVFVFDSWTKLAKNFRTDKQKVEDRRYYLYTLTINKNQYGAKDKKRSTIGAAHGNTDSGIGVRTQGKCIFYPSDSGLYLDMSFFLKPPLLIPWSYAGDLELEQIKILGVGIERYWLEVKTQGRTDKIVVPETLIDDVKKYLGKEDKKI